ncbi:hypothetical protein PENSPDRAFT_692930 [Peniophora sp. CONT]|nr:hypothetical protein PENSPDRAFT_692930 [Peniophora sp. CONT]
MSLLETIDRAIRELQQEVNDSLDRDHAITARLSSTESSSKSTGSRSKKSRSKKPRSKFCLQPYPAEVATVAMVKDATNKLVGGAERQRLILESLVGSTLEQLRSDVNRASACGDCQKPTLKPLFFKGCLHSFCEDCVQKLQEARAKVCPVCRHPLEYRDQSGYRSMVCAQRFPAAEEALFNISAVLN